MCLSSFVDSARFRLGDEGLRYAMIDLQQLEIGFLYVLFATKARGHVLGTSTTLGES